MAGLCDREAGAAAMEAACAEYNGFKELTPLSEGTAMGTQVWTALSRVTGRDPRLLEAEAAFSWVSSELATVDRELASYARKYGVATPAELERLIREGRIEGHPAWEDAIDWSNLIAYREKLLAAAAVVGREARAQ